MRLRRNIASHNFETNFKEVGNDVRHLRKVQRGKPRLGFRDSVSASPTLAVSESPPACVSETPVDGQALMFVGSSTISASTASSPPHAVFAGMAPSSMSAASAGTSSLYQSCEEEAEKDDDKELAKIRDAMSELKLMMQEHIGSMEAKFDQVWLESALPAFRPEL